VGRERRGGKGVKAGVAKEEEMSRKGRERREEKRKEGIDRQGKADKGRKGRTNLDRPLQTPKYRK